MFHKDFKDFLASGSIEMIGVPLGQSFSEAWRVRFWSDSVSGDVFSDLVTSDGWFEFANFFWIQNEVGDEKMICMKTDFFINKVDLYYYREGEVEGCCGLRIESKNGDFINVSGGVFPGSLTLRSNLFRSNYNPLIEDGDPDLKKINLINNFHGFNFSEKKHDSSTFLRWRQIP